jgi:tetratricopeptide (TPR) repeat protein
VPYRIKTESKRPALEPEALLDRYERVSDWVAEHLKPIAATAAVLAAIGLAWGVTAWMGQRAEDQAARLYATAYKTYQSAIETGQQRVLPPEARTAHEQAIAGFQDVHDRYPRTAHAAFALYALGNAHAALEQHDQAIAAYDAWLKEYGDPQDLVPLVIQRLGYAYWAKGSLPQALEQFDRVVKMPKAPNRDQAYFESGRLLEQQGQKDKALESYNKLAAEYPSSPWSSEAMPRIVALGGTLPGREGAKPQAQAPSAEAAQPPAPPQKP